MSKTIIPFRDPSKWETKSDCLFCETIDKLYKLIPTLPTYEEKQQTLSALEDTLLVNGYQLLNVYEGMGEIMNHPNNIDRIAWYPSNRDSFMRKVHNVLYPNDIVDLGTDSKIDEPILIHSRWCRKCARRKPDIFDSLTNERLQLLPITNLKVFTEDEINYISWMDSSSEIWHYTELVKYTNFNFNNPTVLTTYDITIGKNKYDLSMYQPKQDSTEEEIKNFDKKLYCFKDEQIEYGQIYHYQILNYDINNTLLVKSDMLEMYVPTNDIIPPSPINDFSVTQVREIETETMTSKDYLLMSWTDPKDKDYEGTVIRMGDIKLTPPTENDGVEVKARHLLTLPNEIGTTYYFKPFPYDKLKYKQLENGMGYYSYRNYNRDSIPTHLKIKPQLSNVSDIYYEVEDKAINVNWTDPIESNWNCTVVRYKKGSMILNQNDGKFETITDIKDYFKKGNHTLTIPNLENNQEYYVGIFPVSSDNLFNITPENQFKIVTGYYKNDIDINFQQEDWRSKMTYVGKFKVAEDLVKGSVLTNPIVEPNERIIAFVEATDFKYGGALTFDYSCSTIADYDFCNIYVNDEQLLHLEGYKRWESLTYQIPPMDYLKLTIEWIRNYPYDISSVVKFSNIKIQYNSHI